MRRWIIGAACTVVAGQLAAQVHTVPANGADLITADEIRRHIAMIAHDSTLRRATPSRGLEMTAQYIAAQFEALGLTPRPPLYVDPDKPEHAPTIVEHYGVQSWLDTARSRIVIAAGSRQAVASLATAAYVAWPDAAPQSAAPTGVVVVAGRHTVDSLRLPDSSKTIVYIPLATEEEASQFGVLRELALDRNVLVLSTSDSATFARRLSLAQQHLVLDGPRSTWTAQLRPEAVIGLTEVLAASGVNLSQLRTDTTPLVREIPALQVSFELQSTTVAGDSAPNVVGVLEGSDPRLRDQYVVFSAPMDPVSRGQANVIHNGAEDGASGNAMLLALAKAFSQGGPRPARSLVFLATSGTTTGYQGSTAFVDDLRKRQNIVAITNHWGGPAEGVQWRPTDVVVNVTLDRLGRKTDDSVVIAGLSDVELTPFLRWVVTTHPELHLTVVDGGTATTSPGSDHFAFVQMGIPSLYVHGGTQDAPLIDDTTTIDADRIARIAHLMFYVGQALATARQTPHWTDEGRRHYLENMILENMIVR